MENCKMPFIHKQRMPYIFEKSDSPNVIRLSKSVQFQQNVKIFYTKCSKRHICIHMCVKLYNQHWNIFMFIYLLLCLSTNILCALCVRREQEPSECIENKRKKNLKFGHKTSNNNIKYRMTRRIKCYSQTMQNFS